ncbi:STAS domain-containing protein [Puniceicoccaceae bacterium K14]|nr:STAS domain-containing protein [Puniceicoccaceae bacterium K14]
MTQKIHTYTASGDILSTTAGTFWDEVSKIIDTLSSSEVLRLDLRASTMVDSVGLNAVVKIIRAVSDLGSKVQILIASDYLKKLCAFTRLDEKAEIIGP